MRTIFVIFLAEALCIVSGCNSLNPTNEVCNFYGPNYVQSNSIGCKYCKDMEVARLGDFETVDKLIRNKQCFIIPSETDVFIKERVNGDIVSAKLKGSTQLFYTLESNLGAK